MMYVAIIFLSFFSAYADQNDSLRRMLSAASLSDSARAAHLERLVVLYVDAKPDTAVLYAWQLYNIAKRNTYDKRLMASALTALVNGYIYDDKPYKVLQYAFQLLRLAEEQRDTARIAHALFAAGHASGQLSTNNNAQENIAAFQYLQRALQIAQRLQDIRLRADCYNAIGRIYRKELKFDSALGYHNQALTLAKAHNLPFQQGWALHSIAICYENKGYPAKALEYMLEGLHYREQTGNKTIIAISLIGIAQLNQTMGDLQNALVYAKRSLAMGTASESPIVQYQSCECIAQILEALGDFEGALAYQKRFVAIRDSVAALERADDLRSSQAELDLQHSERERAMLLKERTAEQLTLQRLQIIVAIAFAFLILFASALFLLLRARRVIGRRNRQLERAELNILEQMQIQSAQHLEITKLRRILDESTDYIGMTEVVSGTIVYMNKAYMALLGIDELPGTLESLLNIAHPPAIAEFVLRERIPLAIELGILTSETSLLDFEGKHVLASQTTICHKDENGAPVMLSTIMRDITERKRQEQELEQSNTRLRSLLDTVPFSIAVTRRSDGKPLFNNAPMQKLIGLSPNIEEHPQALDYYQDPQDRARVLAELAAKGKIDGIELALKKPSGEHWWALLSMVLMDFEGEQALFSAFQDITVRKRVEAELRSAEERYRLVFLHSGEGLLQTRTDGSIEMANPKACQILGRTEEEICRIGRSGVLDLSDSRIATFLEERRKTGFFKGELNLIHGDGTKIPCELSSTVYTDSTGKERTSLIFHDISERKQAEEMSLQYNQEILRQNSLLDEQARDIEIANSQLEAVNEILTDRNKLLIELDNEKNEIVGIVTHDLKNPLVTVLSFAEMALEETEEMLPQSQKMYIEGIMRTGSRMLELIKKLLDLSALESHSMSIAIIPFDAAYTTSLIVEEYQNHFHTKRITLTLIAEGKSMIYADESLFRQIMDNLISNALKYSPPNTTVRVCITHDDVYVRFAVQDEGPGISAEEMTRLFGKFARLSARPTGGEHSTGLGLSIVKKLAEAMNGKVWCESEAGKGATFNVELLKV